MGRSGVDWAGLLLSLIPRTRHPGLKLIVTPGMVLRWRRDILRRRWAARSVPKGRLQTRRNIKALVLRMAGESEHWGYRRIAGELAGLGIKVAPSTVWGILNKAGIDPAPRRRDPPGRSSCDRRLSPSWPPTSSPSTCSTARPPAS